MSNDWLELKQSNLGDLILAQKVTHTLKNILILIIVQKTYQNTLIGEVL